MKEKECARCYKSLKILYRIKINATKNWYFVCRDCTDIEKKNNKHYVYGGTWKGG